MVELTAVVVECTVVAVDTEAVADAKPALEPSTTAAKSQKGTEYEIEKERFEKTLRRHS